MDNKNNRTNEALINISDEELDELGEQFIRKRVLDRTGEHFSEFVIRYLEGDYFINVEDVVNLNLTLNQAKSISEQFKDKEVRDLASEWVGAYYELGSELKESIETIESVSRLITIDNKVRNLLDN